MKLSLIATLAASAGLLQVGAAPLRVIVVTSNQEISGPGNLPLGHPPLPPVMPPSWVTDGRTNIIHDGARRHPPCGRLSRGGRFRYKAIKISNFFRNALGLPLIETPHHHPHHNRPTHGDGKKYQMLPFIGTPPTFIEITNPTATMEPNRGGDMHILPVMNPKFRNGHALRPQKFSDRLYQAIMSLGKWEGRAVAFVLGCGIGVLIRMFFVLALIAFRSFKGDGQAIDKVTLENDNDHLYVRLPTVETGTEAKPVSTETYTYADEKAPLDNVKMTEDQTK